MKLDHIGYITSDIEASAKSFADLGYSKEETFADDIQKCFICFLTCVGLGTIELVQPYDDNMPMQKILKKRGVSPYHLCYEVEDVCKLFDVFSSKECWSPMFSPVSATAFGGRLITYFFNADAGFIEFVNKN